ncbi:WhiB family transcriptional regulator [Nocardia iowensis]|uniref:Transcriptional regulator WhiB n=1 Tax=Nocardia iowensis TaxID=204891 RepID=A0ABX8RHQ0_NOCIO|nr:WhiB family transcriptional regulator [Nocardia iowensis]QXN88836.1 WhiB family transcriptional regulator [Nocardia iowensis]
MTGFSVRSTSTDAWDWQMRGSCRTEDPAVFYHPDGERGKARLARAKRAKEICRTCPVLAQCRGYALKTREPHGIWGGLSEEERHRIAARTKRRPR